MGMWDDLFEAINREPVKPWWRRHPRLLGLLVGGPIGVAIGLFFAWLVTWLFS
jgi:hypothetical protein